MRRWISALLLAGAAALAGCSDSGPAYVPARGTVRVDGRPVEGAVLVFIPQPGSRVNGGSARTGPDGTYDLFGSHGSGLEPGEYRVMIRRFVQPDGTPVPPGVDVATVPNRQEIPAPYSDRTATPLTVRIDPNSPPADFDLSTRRR